ncbi:hypothetical protein PRBEI_2001491400 [Prionailurus iriomotensis]
MCSPWGHSGPGAAQRFSGTRLRVGGPAFHEPGGASGLTDLAAVLGGPRGPGLQGRQGGVGHKSLEAAGPAQRVHTTLGNTTWTSLCGDSILQNVRHVAVWASEDNVCVSPDTSLRSS